MSGSIPAREEGIFSRNTRIVKLSDHDRRVIIMYGVNDGAVSTQAMAKDNRLVEAEQSSKTFVRRERRPRARSLDGLTTALTPLSGQ